jgi:hypothetical protein
MLLADAARLRRPVAPALLQFSLLLLLLLLLPLLLPLLLLLSAQAAAYV